MVGSTGPADGPAALGLPVVGPGALTGASVAASGTRLTGRLVPDHKTIADFRKDNGGAIRQVCVRFVALCRAMGRLTESSVAIDGSKFKAVNNRDKNVTRAKMDRRMAQIGTSRHFVATQYSGRFWGDADIATYESAPSRMSRKKPAPDLIRGGHRFSEKDMRQPENLALQPRDNLDMGRMFELVNRCHRAETIAAADENAHVAGEGRRIA